MPRMVPGFGFRKIVCLMPRELIGGGPGWSMEWGKAGEGRGQGQNREGGKAGAGRGARLEQGGGQAGAGRTFRKLQ